MSEREIETPDPELPPVGADDAPLPKEQGLERQREETRSSVTNILLLIFLLLLLGAGVAAFVGGNAWAHYADFLRLVLPAVTGLLGSAMGFYFGSRR